MTSSAKSSNRAHNKLKSLIVYGPKFNSRYCKSLSQSVKSHINKRDELSKFPDVSNKSLGSTTRTSYLGTSTSNKKTSQLNKRLTKENINRLHEHFKGCEMGKMNRGELRDTLEKFSIYYNDDEFENLFLKINTDRDDKINWNEIVSYMLLGFEDDFGDKAKELLDPPIKEKPVMRPTRQRYQVVRTDFFPTVLQGQSIDMKQGVFVTIAIDGTVNFYDLDWELQRVGKSPSRKKNS